MAFFRPLPALEPRTEAFWRACRAGRLEFTHCTPCDHLIHQSRPICPKCRGRNLDLRTVSGRARLHSFTVNHQAWYPGQDVPYVIGLVELVEQHGLRLMTNIINCPIEQVQIGMPLRVVFENLSDDVALPLFEPEPVAGKLSTSPGDALRDGPERSGASSGRTVGGPPATQSTARPEEPPSFGGVSKAAGRENQPSLDRGTLRAEPLERRAIISGVGQSAIGRRLFRDDLDLTCEAALAAIADAGLKPDDIDGIAAYPGPIQGGPGFAGPSIYEVQDALGIDVRWHLSGLEGPAQIWPVIQATLAVAAGLCRHALVYRTVTEATAAADTGRRGIGAGSAEIGGFAAFFIPFGAMSAANWLALYARRHMHEFGTKKEHLGIIATTARRHAAFNPKAVYREPMTMDDYLHARLISEPFGLYDCDAPVDGSTVVIVSSADSARDLPHAPVRFNAVGTAMRKRPLWDQWEDITTMAARDAAAHMWSRTDLTPADVDTVQLYDGFSFLALAWIEALGFCGRGEGGPFIENNRLGLGGELPFNTWGGQLSGGRLHGFGFVAEAVRQLRGECGDRQVANCEVAAVGVGGGPVAGCMLLTR